MAYVLVSAMLVYVVIGPNIVTVALAVIGTLVDHGHDTVRQIIEALNLRYLRCQVRILGAFFKGGLEQWQRWQVGRATKKVTVSS